MIAKQRLWANRVKARFDQSGARAITASMLATIKALHSTFSRRAVQLDVRLTTAPLAEKCALAPNVAQWRLPEEPQGDFTAIGVWGQYIYIDPARAVIIVKTSADPAFDDNDHETIAAFRAIARAVAGSE